MNFEKFKNIFYSKDKKDKLRLEEQANTYLKMEMYDLYGQMVGNGYQPTKEQSITVSSFFREKMNSKIATLLENNYKINYYDCRSLLFNNAFLEDYKFFISPSATEESNIAMNKKWRNATVQFFGEISKKEVNQKLAMDWFKEFSDLLKYKHSIFGLNALCSCYELNSEKWKGFFTEENYNSMILNILNFNQRHNNLIQLKKDEDYLLKKIEKQLKEDYKSCNSYEINKLMNETKTVYAENNIEQKTKDLVAKENNFKINQLPIEIQKIIIEIENSCEKLNKIKDVEIQFIVTNTMDKVLPETLKKYFTIDEEYREILKNHQGKSAKDFFVESLMNMNDKLNELLVAKNESGLRDMAINATYTRNIKNN